MSSDSYNPHNDTRYVDCYSARYIPLDSITNPDMVGIAVSATNVVVVFCLRILIDLSPTEIDVGIQGCLFQSYPILLSTLLSINRDQLSLFDAFFAMSISSSPLTVYLVFASVGDILGFKTGLYKWVRHHHFIRTALILVPFLWLGLSMTLRLSNQAFKDSKLCDGSTFIDWLKDMLSFLLTYVNPTYIVGPAFIVYVAAILILLCLFRRRYMVFRDIRDYWERAPNLWRRFLIPLVSVKCAWRIVKHNHSWCIHFLFLTFDIVWVTQVMATASFASGTGYVLSYGQLLSMFAAIPTILSALNVLGVIWHHRTTTRSPNVHQLIWAEVHYLFTGIEIDPPAQDNGLPLIHQRSPSLASRSVVPPIEVGEGENAGSLNRAGGAILQAVSATSHCSPTESTVILPLKEVIAGSSVHRDP